MAGLTLIVGAAASGKTVRLVDVAAARSEVDRFAACLVLVPTARHADQFRRRLVSRVGVALRLDVTTFNLFARRHLPTGAVASADVADEILRRVIQERAIGDGPASRFHAIAETPGLVDLLGSALGDLISDAVTPERFAGAAYHTGDRDLMGLADIFNGHRAALDAHGWRDPHETLRLVAETLAGDAAPLPPLVLVDGIHFLRAGEVEVISALAQRTDVWVALDPSAGARAAWTERALREAVPGLTVEQVTAPARGVAREAMTASDAEAQLREITRSIKARLILEPSLRPSDFAVVFRQATPHLSLARRVFEEAQLPLDPAAGEALARRPFGAWLLRLLRVGAHGWRMRDVLDVVGAGFADWTRWGFESGDLEVLRATARRHQLWSGVARLRALPTAIEADLDGTKQERDARRRGAAAAWLRAVDGLVAVLDPGVERTPAAHARLLDEALFGVTGWVRSQLDAYPTLEVEVNALRRDLASMRAVDEALPAPAIPFLTFVQALEARMQRPSALIRDAGGVLLAPMHTLHGLRFEHVYVAGLSEGEFPAPPRAAALLNRNARQRLRDAGLDLPPEPRAAEDELWQSSISRAEQRLSLWRPRLAGRPVAASYYFDASGVTPEDIDRAAPPERAISTRELAIGLTSGWPAEQRRPAAFAAWAPVVRIAPGIEQRRRSFATAGMHEGALPGADMGWLVAPGVPWSPSRLESYRTCPFQFFASYALKLHELDDEDTQADAATRGTVMHDMLDEAIAPLVPRGLPLVPATVPEVIERLRTLGRARWDRAPEEHSFGRAALWRYEGRVALDQLEAMVNREALHNQALGIEAVVGGEKEFNATLLGSDPSMALLGRADRVDRGVNLIQIVDYKTGRSISKAEVTSGRRLQLQLYALAAQEQFGDVRLVARYSFLRPPKDEWTLDSADAEDRAILAAAAQTSIEVRAAVTAGRFEVLPQTTPCPSYCSFRLACRVNAFSRSKTWP